MLPLFNVRGNSSSSATLYCEVPSMRKVCLSLCKWFISGWLSPGKSRIGANCQRSSKLEKFAAFLKTDREDGFRLDTPPLARLALIRLSDDTFKFVWSVSALLLDGWSWPLVFRDLSRIYESLQQATASGTGAASSLSRLFEMAAGAESGRRQSILGEHAQGLSRAHTAAGTDSGRIGTAPSVSAGSRSTLILG